MACIDPQFIEKIKKLNLADMNTADRIKVLDDTMGSGGKDINLLYEKKLLLKNRDKSFDRFIDELDGTSAEKKAKLKEQIAKRLELRKETINTEELLGIVKDTLDKKYDIDIPDEAVNKMFKLRKEIDTMKPTAMATPDGSDAKLALGEKEGEFMDVISELKNPSDKSLVSTIKESLQESKARISAQEGILGKTGQTLKEVFTDIFAIPAKGIKAAWDASYLFRQGLKVLTADPSIWAKQAGGSLKSWGAILNKEAMEKVYKGFRADIITRDMYQDAIDSGLAIGILEDFFPTNIAEKFPGIVGRIFKASDDSFTMFAQGSRMDMFEKYVKLITENNNGIKPDKEALKSIADYVNGLTGRGGLGKFESSSGILNNLLFSARYQVANIKTFTDPLLAQNPMVRKIAAKNLAKHTALILGTMTTLAAITDVGFDPRESTFGKARVPGSKKWVDVTGGLASYIALLGKMQDKMSSKPKYGQPSAMDILTDFFKGKLAPVPGTVRDILEQRTFAGQKPDVVSTLRSLFVPITVDNIITNAQKGDEVTTNALTSVFDILGAGVSQPKSKGEGSYGSPIDLFK